MDWKGIKGGYICEIDSWGIMLYKCHYSQKFEFLQKYIKKNTYYLQGIQTLCYETLSCILFALIIIEMFLQLDWSPPVVNTIDWTWFGKEYTCLYKVPHTWQCMSE